MATKELAVEAWIWANILILFREIDPPELFRDYGLKQAEFDTLTQLLLSDRPLTQTELKKRILTDEGRGFVEPRLAQHIKRISKYFSPLTDLEKEILLKILTKLRKTVA